VIDADGVTEVATTESPPSKEESSIIFGKPKQGQNTWEVRQNSKILYWQSCHSVEDCQSKFSRKSKAYFLARFAKS